MQIKSMLVILDKKVKMNFKQIVHEGMIGLVRLELQRNSILRKGNFVSRRITDHIFSSG